MNRRPLHTDKAPKAIGPYSQAIEVKGAGRMVFLSGQVALDPATDELGTRALPPTHTMPSFVQRPNALHSRLCLQSA